jgi:glucose-1-phosphate cytidylyltransferase
MKVVILAGGFGTRLSEQTSVRPKPMVEIGDEPILWHIMKIYHSHGFRDFVICCGYKGFVIKEYFANYVLHHSDVTFRTADRNLEIHKSNAEDWSVTLVDTGQNTMTGGRLKRVAKYLDENEPFCLTYGDGVSDVDIGKLVAFHREQGKMATMTAVQPPGRFGAFSLGADETQVTHFREKPKGDNAWINGGFFVLEHEVLDFIDGDDTVWERGPMEQLSRKGELNAFRHSGFWQPMDTLRDRMYLEELWESGSPPWKTW